MGRFAYLTRAVWLLSLISLFTDLASEMLYPVMPLYLQSIGFSVLLIGLLEGVAEAVAGLSKGYFGQWSDRLGRRVPFVQGGYGLSALSKPMLAVLAAPWWVFLARTVDRLGKGLRTGRARCAALRRNHARQQGQGVRLSSVDGHARARCWARLVALLWLAARPGQFRPLFWWAFVPGVLAVAVTFALRERPAAPSGRPPQPFWASFRLLAGGPARLPARGGGAARLCPVQQLRCLPAAAGAAAGRVRSRRYRPLHPLQRRVRAQRLARWGTWPTAWGRAGCWWAGCWPSPRCTAGWRLARDGWAFAGLFALYGLYAASTEGVAKAWVSNLCAPAPIPARPWAPSAGWAAWPRWGPAWGRARCGSWPGRAGRSAWRPGPRWAWPGAWRWSGCQNGGLATQ
ncbi:MAG: MFS transporter [Hymenobacter sp.]